MTVVDDIKARLDITDVVSGYIELKQAGSNFKAPCPFHDEKTPSFIVSPGRQTWHCFGACSTGGDVISFVMKRESIDFGEALRVLADRAGVSIGTPNIKTKSTSTYEINESAAKFFSSVLYSENGQIARDYLKSRGIDQSTAQTFDLGMSPPQQISLNLFQHLKLEGFSNEQILESKLVNKYEDGNTNDFFRNRIMFPIKNRRGKIAGFGARSIDNSEPKYINTPKTDVFDKSGILYGLDISHQSIIAERQAVVVEGYMDVIAAHQHNNNNVIASMGTAVTDVQISQLKSLCDTLILALDSDAAGQEATLRKLEEILIDSASQNMMGFNRRIGPIIKRNSIEIKICRLPEGSDPDDLIRNDLPAWQKLIDESVKAQEFMIDALPIRFDLGSGSGKTAALEWISGLIYASNPFDQQNYKEKIAAKLDIASSKLDPILRELGRKSKRSKSTSPRKSIRNEPITVSNIPNSEVSLDEYTLAIMLNSPELKDIPDNFSPECFIRSEDREIFTQWLETGKLDVLKSTIDDSLQPRLEQILDIKLKPIDLRQAFNSLEQCFSRIEERHLRKLQEGLLSTESSLASSKDLEEAIVKMNNRIKEIHSQRG
ncbi:MAG: DNA primase [Dehalococcoidia bacterium]|nr:DNA primase [Dehalococcoidia bacterium]MQG15480.1 DNA primase [SAR202 cluster bacterium]|tara:strand:- start:27444 stop:29249 length:1806 start_codon:yes stop_codon:yes gene_type:complete